MNLYYGYLKNIFYEFYNNINIDGDYHFLLIVNERSYSSLYYNFIFDRSDLYIQNKYNSELKVIGYGTNPKIDMQIFKNISGE